MDYASLPNKTREAVKVRDRSRCLNCGADGEDVKLDVHHIVPRGQGGSDRMSNLVLLCRQCHEAAHEKQMAPTVEFSSTGEMQQTEFELFKKFFDEVPSARFDAQNKRWRVPIRDMELLVNSLGELPVEEVESHGHQVNKGSAK
jgi:hypothetical protein